MSTANSPAASMDSTGERLVTSLAGDVVAEHLHRYAVARAWAVGREVLDLASGEGYGSALLAEVAQSVTGVDVDAAATAHAAAKYVRPNLRFLTGPATAIPLPDGAVDLAVSFETIEHLTEQEEMLAELRRVLRPGGRLIISTPDRSQYSEAAHYQNPFHLKELDGAEFEALLRRHFSEVRLFGQRMVYGSLIGGSEGTRGLDVHGGDFAKLHTTAGVPRPRYWIAACSDAPLPDLAGSLFEDEIERATIENTAACFRVEAAPGSWWTRLRRALRPAPALRLEAELRCKIRSFTVTLRGRVPLGTTAVRATVRGKIFEGKVSGEEFIAEVNVGSGRHPCVIEIPDENGSWRAVLQVRLEAPEVAFQARERRA